jgi:hypothetical protein
MKMMRRQFALRAAILSAAWLLGLAVDGGLGPTHAGSFDLGGKSRLLDQNMTERDVAAVVGSEPQIVVLKTCGADAHNPWICKVQEYRDRRYHLEILFSRADDGAWHVKEWSFK